MIRKLKLENFKGIKNGEIRLAPLTILLGANNSGKTTILEALFLAPNPFREVPYGVHRTAVEIVHFMHKTLDSEGFAFLFNKYATKDAKIECRIDGDEYLLQFIRDDSYIYVSTNKEIGSEVNIRGRAIRCIGELRVETSSLTYGYGEALIGDTLLLSPSLIKLGYEYLKGNWASIVNLGICKKIAEEASAFSNEKYADLTIEPFFGEKLSIYAYVKDGFRIRLGDLGEGIQSYVIARVLYEIVEPEVLLWDDVEAHFNPKMLLRVSQWLSDIVDSGRQVILATHSLEAARIVAGMAEEEAKIYLTSLNDGIFKAKELTLEEVEELLKAGIDVRVAETLLL